MKVITAGALLIAAVGFGLVFVGGFNYIEKLGYDRGVKAGQPINCYPFVKAAEDSAGERAVAAINFVGAEAYKHGVLDTVNQIKEYILDACVNQQEFTVADEQFVCLKKQEM